MTNIKRAIIAVFFIMLSCPSWALDAAELMSAGKYQEALAELPDEDSNTKNTLKLQQLGECYFQLGQYDKAVKRLTQSLDYLLQESKPQPELEKKVRIGLVNCYRAQKNYEQAILAGKSLAEKFPDSSSQLMLVYNDAKKYDEALAIALTLSGKFSDADVYTARLYELKGDAANAKEYMKRAKASGYFNAELADLYLGYYQYADAAETYRKLENARAAKKGFEFYPGAFISYFVLGDYDNALQYAQTAVETLGAVKMRVGNVVLDKKYPVMSENADFRVRDDEEV